VQRKAQGSCSAGDVGGWRTKDYGNWLERGCL
jgi:hypothetical protein